MGDNTTHAADQAAPAALLERAGDGCEEAWQQLVDRHLAMVHAICAGHGLEPTAAAQVNQLVWLRLAEQLTRIRRPEAVGGWIAATARLLCLDPRWASERSGYMAGSVGRAALHGAGRPVDARVAVSRRNDRRHHGVAAAFARVGSQCQRLLRLAATSPKPSDEDVGAALDLATATVQPTCARCLRRLGRMVGSASDEVLAELRSLLARGDGVPGEWRAAARTAFAWVLIEAPLAARVYDATRPRGQGGVGAADLGTVRQMRFATPDDGVELSLEVKGDELAMTGQVLSAAPAKVVVHWAGGEQLGAADETGAFRFHDLPQVPLYLRLDGPHPLKTGWLVP